MDITVILQQMTQFFLIMCLGYILYKIGMITADFSKKLTSLVLHVTMPALILSSVLTQTGERNLSEVLVVFGVAIAMYVSLPILGWIVVKILRFPVNIQGMYIFMTVFSNVGFMGIPLISALYGEKAVFYTAIFNLIFNIAVFTIGTRLMNYKSGKSEKLNFKTFLTPGVCVASLAVVIYFLNIPFPKVVVNSISSVGSITTPVAMIMMGASLAKLDVKNIFNDYRVYLFAVVKQVVLPLGLWPLLNLTIKNEYILAITMVMLCMPVANNAVLFAVEHNKDEELAAKNIFISTILSIATIPLIMGFVF